MTKYHINKNGVPAICRAKKGNCPLGGQTGSENHFNTSEEAQAAADKMNEAQYGIIKDLTVNKVTQEDMDAVYNQYDTQSTFMVDVDSLEYLGYLDDSKNPEAVKQEFVDKFGEGSFVIQSEGKDKVIDMIKYSYESDALNQRFQEIGYELNDEGYNGSLFDEDSKDYYENNEDFRNAYKDFLANRQGDEVDFYGKTLRTVESPHSENTKQFFKDYVQGNFNEEIKNDFKASAYDPMVNSTEHLSYIARVEDEFFEESLADAKNPEAIKKVFYDNFDKDSLVVEITSDDPLSYSMYSNSEGVSYSYETLRSNLYKEGYDSDLLDPSSDDFYENNEHFKNAYRDFLKENQKSTKKVFGVNMAQVEDPLSEKTKNFFKDYIEKNK